MHPERETLRFRLINADITGLCNLRCRFCFNDFSKADRAFMDPALLEALTGLLDLVPDERFFVSCLYEPTLHPRFADILGLIPESGRRKAFLTTNLARRLGDAEILALARANLARINVSIETLRPDVHRFLCGSRRFGLFLENLGRLAEACRRNPAAPRIHPITMVLRANMAELPAIVRVCASRFHAADHELRTPYYDTYPNQAFVEDQLLSRAELEALAPALQATGADISCDFSIWREEFLSRRAAGRAGGEPERADRLVPPRLFDVRVNADGTAELHGGTIIPLRPETAQAVLEDRLRALHAGLPDFFPPLPEGAAIPLPEPAPTGRAAVERRAVAAGTVTVTGRFDGPEAIRPTHARIGARTMPLERLPRPNPPDLPPSFRRTGFRTALPEAAFEADAPVILLRLEDGRAVLRWDAD